MSNPLICYLGSKPQTISAQNDECDWVYVQLGDDVFETLGDRLPDVIVEERNVEPAQSQLNMLPGFAVGRWMRDCVPSNFRSYINMLKAKRPTIYYISDIAPNCALRCATHLTFDQFHDLLCAMQEAYLIFDARLCSKFERQDAKMRRFYETTWQSNLSQFRGFVSTFMHVLEQDMTPQVELWLCAVANKFPPNCYDGLHLKPMHCLFEQLSPPECLTTGHELTFHVDSKTNLELNATNHNPEPNHEPTTTPKLETTSTATHPEPYLSHADPGARIHTSHSNPDSKEETSCNLTAVWRAILHNEVSINTIDETNKIHAKQIQTLHDRLDTLLLTLV